MGLDVGRVSHREIAVGVQAELVRLRAGGELVRAARPERLEVVAAIDPMCGVTVDVGSARHKVDHEGGQVLLLLSGVRQGIRGGSQCIHRVGDEVVNRMFGPRVLKESE